MNYEIIHKPSYSFLKVKLSPGQTIKAESGAMVYMTPGIDVETKMGSGFLSAISRRFFGGESFFFNVFKASVTGGEIGLAPELPGDIVGIDLTDTGLIVESGAYLASDETISIKPMFGGIRSFFGGEGIFLLEAFGNGKLFLNAYGGIIPIDVQGSYTIDTGHIVAFDKSLQYKIAKAGGSWKSTFFGGEGLVMEFTGHGRVLIQTRVPSGFLSWLTALLPN
ncbi:TIGR00266 family protein [Leptospira interrogans]|uniref:TIGR00266 family protein n=3 Tax=Leptospira interrogans TaxID=173 RepID=M6KH39_LEPIR|nr:MULTISPECIES: TIGR00266 family protein [Leptospira]EMN30998.1 TIGR00266 family protein [Leptospira interrogans serovar Pyrogenes str. L0374]EKO08309.1 TIGR00266 family protein [Leptospira interrogans str. C10069]EKO23828.1 TIGR00266 family protein [Leptospira interrogans str. UI 12621]EMJ51389.1 TIGR00266 family protein [Leptospira interrogans str. UT126]EMN60461.1 TIGR00266 family protein [Leptospira interrogans serovar Pyrogenes str. R168]